MALVVVEHGEVDGSGNVVVLHSQHDQLCKQVNPLDDILELCSSVQRTPSIWPGSAGGEKTLSSRRISFLQHVRRAYHQSSIGR